MRSHDRHRYRATWAENCLAWVVSCPCGYINVLWWADTMNHQFTIEKMLDAGWDPFRDLHNNPTGLVILPDPED